MQFQRLAAAALLLAMAACNRGTRHVGQPPLDVDVATAKRQNIATYLTLDGQVAPLEQSSLAFQQSGPITGIYANVGDRVARGQLLARIDDSLLRAQLAQAQATYQQASASARGAVVGLPVQQTQNTNALSATKAALANARLTYQQDSNLYRQGYVSQSALEAARAAYVQAQGAYENASIGIRNNVVAGENVKASLAAAQSALAQERLLETEISQTYLYAPYDGVITQRFMDPGSQAGPATPVLAISRVNTVWINVNVPDQELEYVTPSKVVSFVTDSLPGRTFHGTIATVNAVPTAGTLSYLARMTLPNPGGILRGGMLVTVTVTKALHRNTVVVPRSAVAQGDTGAVVYSVQNGHAVAVPVRVGIQTDTLSEVFSPKIGPGTVVITTRPDALHDGSLVAVASASVTR